MSDGPILHGVFLCRWRPCLGCLGGARGKYGLPSGLSRRPMPLNFILAVIGDVRVRASDVAFEYALGLERAFSAPRRWADEQMLQLDMPSEAVLGEKAWFVTVCPVASVFMDRVHVRVQFTFPVKNFVTSGSQADESALRVTDRLFLGRRWTLGRGWPFVRELSLSRGHPGASRRGL